MHMYPPSPAQDAPLCSPPVQDQPSSPTFLPLKLHSINRGTSPSGISKKSMNAQPLMRGPTSSSRLSWDGPASRSNSHSPTREFTPANPSLYSGHPRPRAITGGNARGRDDAERKVIERTGLGQLSNGTRMSVETAAFSGIHKNDGIAYLPSRN